MIPFNTLAGLAWSDMISRRSRWTGLTMLITVCLVAGVCLACYSLVWGKRNVDLARINDDPSALVLRVGNAYATQRRVNNEILEMIQSQLDRQPDVAKHVRALHPYRACIAEGLNVFKAPGLQPGDLIGRTITIRNESIDLFLQGRKISRGRLPSDVSDHSGIAVSPRALRKLSLELDAAVPLPLHVSVAGHAPTVDIVGVFEEDLPDHYDFVISERQEQELLARPRVANYVKTGSMPEAWINTVDWQTDAVEQGGWRTLISASEEAVKGQSYEIRKLQLVQLLGPKLRIQVGYNDADGNSVVDLSDAEWNFLVQSLAKALEERTGVNGPEFTKLHFDEVLETTNTMGQAYDLVNIYVDDAQALRPIARICDEVIKGFNDESTINYDVIRRLESINASFQTAVSIANSQQLIIVLLASFSLVVLQVLRSAEKAAEFGMLRAMGMRRSQIMQFVFLQATILGCIGVLLGLILGWVCAFGLTFVLYEEAKDITRGLFVPWFLPINIVVGSIVISLISALVSSWPLLRRSPSELMN